MKMLMPYIIGILVVALAGSGYMLVKFAGDIRQNKIELAAANATVKRLKEDAAKLKELEASNKQLSKQLKDAEKLYAQVQDPSGCFTRPVPKPASDQLRAIYKSVTAGARRELIQTGSLLLPGNASHGEVVHERTGQAMEGNLHSELSVADTP